MERVLSFDLVVAELVKCARAPFVRGLFAVAWFAVTIVLALYDVNQAQSKALLYPVSLNLASSSLVFLGHLVPPIFFAWLFGHEASADTWKTILVRRPRRLPFLTAKVVVGAVVVLAAAVVGALLQIGVFELTGLATGAPRFVDETARWTADAIDNVVQAVVATAVACSFAGAAAMIARSNGTIIGFVAAYVLQMVGGFLFPDPSAPEAALMFTHRATHLASACSGVALAEFDAPLARLSVVGDVVVVGAWCVLPLALAAVIFSRRDLVSSVG
jgi:ABC-type transport system involved in multi-copper enzyme maturation permease subunit